MKRTPSPLHLGALLLGLTAAVHGQNLGSVTQDLGSVTFTDLYDGDQNLGKSVDVFAGNLTITARTNLNPRPAYEFAFAPGPDDHYKPTKGTVFLNDDDNFLKGGLGVKTLYGGGSKGISGSGGDQNEQLVFTYNTLGARLDTVGIFVTDLEFGHGLDDKDDPVMWITTQNGNIFVSEAILAMVAQPFGTSSEAAKAFQIDFGDLVGKVNGLSGGDEVSSFLIRETNSHIFVNGVTAGMLIPEPSGLVLLGLAGAGLVFRRRRS